MQTIEPSVVEREPRGKGRRRSDTMTACARSFGMTRAAKIGRARRTNAMLTDPVTVVNDVARRQDMLARKIDMTAVAVARLPLILMLMTSEARGHRRTQRHGLRLCNAGVALNAIAMNGRHVLSMIEKQMLARHLRTLPRRSFAMAERAIALIMRFFVAFATFVGRGQMHRMIVVGGRDAGVTTHAAHPFVHVRAMLEGM
jgi:hypothetical protein